MIKGGKVVHSSWKWTKHLLPRAALENYRDVHALNKLQSTVQMCFVVIIEARGSGTAFSQSSHHDPQIEATRILMKQVRTKSSRVEYSRKHQSVAYIIKTLQDLLFQ